MYKFKEKIVIAKMHSFSVEQLHARYLLGVLVKTIIQVDNVWMLLNSQTLVYQVIIKQPVLKVEVLYRTA